MPLEKELAANTEAVIELTAVMKTVAENQAKILKAAGATKSETTDEDEQPKKRASRREADDEDDAPPKKVAKKREDDDGDEAPPAPPKKAEKKPAGDKKPAKLTAKDVRAAIANFMDIDDKDEEDERNDFIESMFEHLDVENAGAIEEKDYEDVIGWLKRKAAGKKVTFD